GIGRSPGDFQRTFVAVHRLANVAGAVFLHRIAGGFPVIDGAHAPLPLALASSIAAGTRRRTRLILKPLRPFSLAPFSSAAMASAGEAPDARAASASTARQGLWATAPSATFTPATATLARPAA